MLWVMYLYYTYYDIANIFLEIYLFTQILIYFLKLDQKHHAWWLMNQKLQHIATFQKCFFLKRIKIYPIFCIVSKMLGGTTNHDLAFHT